MIAPGALLVVHELALENWHEVGEDPQVRVIARAKGGEADKGELMNTK